MLIRQYESGDLDGMIALWNGIVEEGVAFPQEETLDRESGARFFAGQSRSAAALGENGEVLGLYILHPNNVGRCGHISNASYGVRPECRGRGIGEALVRDCLGAAKALGFRILQFNAVVESNARARRLYEKLGFHQLGVIPGGFRMSDGHYENICPYYIEL